MVLGEDFQIYSVKYSMSVRGPCLLHIYVIYNLLDLDITSDQLLCLKATKLLFKKQKLTKCFHGNVFRLFLESKRMFVIGEVQA